MKNYTRLHGKYFDHKTKRIDTLRVVQVFEDFYSGTSTGLPAMSEKQEILALTKGKGSSPAKGKAPVKGKDKSKKGN